MIKNVRNVCLRAVSAVLSLACTVTAIPMQAYADEIIPDNVYIQEIEMTEDILSSDVFYLTAPNARLLEGANERYYLRIGRGGDSSSAASVNVKIADLTAKYGDDYEIYLLDSEVKTENPEDNQSLLEMMEGEDYTVTPIVEEDEFNEMAESDDELKQSAQEAVNESIKFIEDAAALTPAEPADGSENVSTDPLQEARARYTGIEGEPQNVTASQDTFMQIQEIADVLTTAVVGANLKVDFAEGEDSKYIVIDVDNNLKSDGDRYFYLMLSDPEGTTTISSASSCAMTIVDDEEQEPSEVSFGECTFNEEGDTLSVEIKRKGALNSLADVQLITEGITAQAGRDFSVVDMSVAFPMGIDTRTIDIPVCSDYLTDDAEFSLKLTNNQGANVVTAEKTIVISGANNFEVPQLSDLDEGEFSSTLPESPEYMAAKNKRTLGTIETAGGINLTNRSGGSADNHFTGYNGMYGNSYKLRWQGGNGWKRFWHNYKGSVGAEWRMSAYSGFEYAGAQVNWSKSNTCASISAGFEGQWGYENSSARELKHGAAYSSNNSLNNTTTNLFSNITDPIYINIVNRGNCDDCNDLWVNSIKPIKRPFIVELSEADKLKFLQEDGSMKVDDGTATYLAVDGAENNDKTQSVIYYADETVTFKQVVGKNVSTPYTYLKQLKSTDGFMFATFGNNGSSTYSKNLSTQFINDNSAYNNTKLIKFYDNTYMRNSNPNSGCEYGKYGSIKLKPTFDYKNAEVRVIVPSDNFGYLNISGTDKKISSSTSYTYHLGDTLQFSTKMYDQYSKIYEPVGFEVKYKTNKSDSNWKEIKKVTYQNGKAYLDSNRRLANGYYEVTPLFQTKGNLVTVRIAESDLGNFDTSYGLFATNMVSSKTINNKKYKEYVVYSDVKSKNIYSLAVKSKNKNVYPVWKSVSEKDKYSGEVFYFEAQDSKDKNVIELSVEKYTDSHDYYHTLSGKVLSRVYNMQTDGLDETTMKPHSGALITVGDSYAVAGKDGSFKVSGIRAVPGTSVRYLVTVNGEVLLKEKKLGTKAKSSVQKITLPDTTVKEVKLISNEVGNVFINTENGSILNNIDVWVEDMNNAGYSIIADPDQTIKVRAQCSAAVSYMMPEKSTDGSVVEKEAKENLTDVTFVIYDNESEIKAEYPATFDSENSNYYSSIPLKNISPGYGLYVRVKTDKSLSGLSGEKMVYSDAYTGYFFTQDTSAEMPPVEASIQPMTNMNFIELPLLGDSGFNFDFPFVSVSIDKTDTGYRMSIGVGVLQVVDKIRGSNISDYDDVTGIKDIFSIKHPFDTFSKGIKESASFISNLNDVAKKSADAAKKATSALGAPTWKFDVQLGAYFEFTYVELTNPENGAVYTDAIFTGVGGYIGVSGGFQMAWYTIIPVVFLPAYFGIEIDASILGYFGAATDQSKPKITYESATNAKVDYGKSLGKFDMSIRMSAKVQVYVGVGLCGLLGLRGGATVEVMGQYAPSEVVSDWGAAITFTAGIWVDLFLFSIPLQYKFPELKFGSFKEIAEASQQIQNNVKAKSNFELRAPYSTKDSSWLPSGTASNNTVKSNDGLSSLLPGSPEYMAGFSESSSYTLVSDGYEHPDVQLLKLSDGSIFMAFLDTDTSREDSERTVLKYAVYKDGKWSDPAVVSDDGTADFQPSICEMDNSRVMIAWLSSDPQKQISEEAEDYLASLEVYTAVIDYDAKTPVSEVTRLTTDEYYDYLPLAAYDEVTGDRAVYFVKTASNGSAVEMSNSYTNDCVVVYMLYSDPENDGEGRWLFDYYYDDEVGSEEEKQILIDNWKGQRFLASPIPEFGIDVPNISDFTVTTYNGLAVYAYTIDQDSSNDTSFDKELFVQFYDFETHKTYTPVRLSNDNVPDAIPQFVRIGSGEEAYTALFWYRDEKDIAYVDITDLIRNGVDEDGQILDEYMQREGMTGIDRIYSYVGIGSDDSNGYKSMSDFKPIVDGDDVYIVWTQIADGKNEGELCREVFATALIHPDENDEENIGCAWANPYRLTYAYACTDEPAVAIDTNGNMMVTYNQYNQEITEDPENPVNITDFVLKASYMEPCGAVDVENIEISDATPVEGETVNITFEAVNNGLTYAAGYTVGVYAEKDGKSELIKTIESDTNLIPGEKENYLVEWEAPADAEGYVIKTDSYENGGNWTNHSYAESEPFIKRAEYIVDHVSVSQDGDGFTVSYDVTNTGNAESTDEDEFDMILVGPYCDTFGCTKEECMFAEVPVGGIAAGETKSFTEKLDVPVKVFEKYGYVNCLAIINDKDGKQLTDGEDIRIGVSQPLNLKLNGEDYPTEITMSVGESLNLDVSCTPALISNNLETVFGSDDSDIVVADGNTIKAAEAGTTVIHASAGAYGNSIPDITVKVIDGSGFTVRNVDEGIIIKKYIGEDTDRIEIPSEIDGKKVVGVDDFAFGSVSDDVIITVPDTLMSEYIGDEAFMTYAVVNEQIIEKSGGTTVNEVLKYWINDVGGMNYTDDQIADAVAKVLEHIGDTKGMSMSELVMEVLRNADNLGFSQENLDKLELALSLMSYNKVKLEGPADTDSEKYASGKINLEYIISEKGLKGDVTLDGKVNLYDVIAIAKYVMDSKKYPLSDEAISNGDVTENGKLDIYDAIEIAKIIMA